MKPKLKISEVLDRAINTYLWNGKKSVYGHEYCSCSAVEKATKHDKVLYGEVRKFIIELGVDCVSTREYQDFHWGEQRQYARALWLTWASMIAKEEGL